MVLRPMLARSADQLPIGKEWSYEVKWDGYRTLALKDGPQHVLWARGGRIAWDGVNFGNSKNAGARHLRIG